MTALDIFFLLVIAFFAIIAAFRGLINVIMGKIALAGALAAAILFYQKLAVPMTEVVHKEPLAKFLSFLMIFMAVFLLAKIFQQFLQWMFSADILRSLNHALGFLFGAAEGAVIVAVILVILQAQPWFDVSSLLEHSLFYKLLASFISVPASKVEGMLQDVR